MLLNRALLPAALLGAAFVNSPAAGQVVPSPPPAGVQAVPRKSVPPEQESAQEAQPQPEAAAKPQLPASTQAPPDSQSEGLPQLPENPIRLDDDQAQEKPPVQSPTVVATPTTPGEAAVGYRPPVKPKGPVYYYPVDPYSFPANVTTPPPMHVPNSPYVEDLSVAGDHGRYTYYSYRRPWYTPGHLSANVTIVW